MGEHEGAYRRRRPEGTVLYEAVRDNLATLLAEASEVGRGLPRYVERDFARYLECGVLAYGFARVRCESCKEELLVWGQARCPALDAILEWAGRRDEFESAEPANRARGRGTGRETFMTRRSHLP